MRPYVWQARPGKWLVARSPSVGPNWPMTTWPGTKENGYPTLGEAMDAARATFFAPA